MKTVTNLALNTETESAFLMDKGSWCPSRTVLGKNDCCLEVVLNIATSWALSTSVATGHYCDTM